MFSCGSDIVPTKYPSKRWSGESGGQCVCVLLCNSLSKCWKLERAKPRVVRAWMLDVDERQACNCVRYPVSCRSQVFIIQCNPSSIFIRLTLHRSSLHRRYSGLLRAMPAPHVTELIRQLRLDTLTIGDSCK